MNHQETHQTNPMAPWDPGPRCPLDPLGPPVPKTKISSTSVCISLAKSFTKPMCSVAGKNFFKALSDCGWEHGEGWLARKGTLINGRTLATNFPSVTDTKPLQVPKINYRADVFVTSWKLTFREMRSGGGWSTLMVSLTVKIPFFWRLPLIDHCENLLLQNALWKSGWEATEHGGDPSTSVDAFLSGKCLNQVLEERYFCEGEEEMRL